MIRYLIGDTRNVLATLEPGSVDLVLSSPPFLALRSYLPADHPDKQHEIGSEATPGEFIDVLLDVVEACARVLAPHGSLVFELGDTYAGSGGGGGDYLEGGWREGQAQFAGSGASMRDSNAAHARMKARARNQWPLDKSLTLVPQLFAYALAYGHNPLTGRQTDRWRVRNIVRWVRPNPPVGALGDKYRPATSELIVACKARDRYFDLDAVREPYKVGMNYLLTKGHRRQHTPDQNAGTGSDWTNRDGFVGKDNGGAPPLDWWQIPTAPYRGSHYATWPPQLCVRPILSMCPERVCTTCGKPSRRIAETEYEPHGNIEKQHAEPTARADYPLQQRNENTQGMQFGRATKHVSTLGWTCCGCADCEGFADPFTESRITPRTCTVNHWRPGHVLDPFAGSATTLAVAHGHSRNATGIDLDPRNAELAYGRLGMFLEVTDLRTTGAAPVPFPVSGDVA